MTEKVERSSVRDRESRRVIGRRLKMLWGFLGFLSALFLILAMTRQWRGNEHVVSHEVVHSANKTEVSEEGVRQGNEQQMKESLRDNKAMRQGSETRIRLEEIRTRSSAVDADATLRLFDEL